uniref:BPTI/Kunitz domain-containing protein-like isoform X5 n=1 Tax=Myxine glutinosa TaxID=7769 RepID=UPI00358FDC24
MTPFMLIPLALLCLRVDCDNSVQQRNVCSLPAVTGPCRASLRRYFFNQETMRCEKFIYGGCRGNENNFEDLENCEERCMGRREADLGEVCTLSPSKGRCTASKRRFFFNPRSMKCQRFVYGGCGGNGNNFVSKQDCENNCKPLEVNVTTKARSQDFKWLHFRISVDKTECCHHQRTWLTMSWPYLGLMFSPPSGLVL